MPRSVAAAGPGSVLTCADGSRDKRTESFAEPTPLLVQRVPGPPIINPTAILPADVVPRQHRSQHAVPAARGGGGDGGGTERAAVAEGCCRRRTALSGRRRPAQRRLPQRPAPAPAPQRPLPQPLPAPAPQRPLPSATPQRPLPCARFPARDRAGGFLNAVPQGQRCSTGPDLGLPDDSHPDTDGIPDPLVTCPPDPLSPGVAQGHHPGPCSGQQPGDERGLVLRAGPCPEPMRLSPSRGHRTRCIRGRRRLTSWATGRNAHPLVARLGDVQGDQGVRVEPQRAHPETPCHGSHNGCRGRVPSLYDVHRHAQAMGPYHRGVPQPGAGRAPPRGVRPDPKQVLHLPATPR